MDIFLYKPHTHTLTHTHPTPSPPQHTQAESLLASGVPYKTQLMSGARGRGLVVQDIAAPSTVVWSRILDFDHYTEMVPRTVISENYGVKGGRDREIKTRMKLSAMVTQIEFFIRHMVRLIMGEGRGEEEEGEVQVQAQVQATVTVTVLIKAPSLEEKPL